MVRKMGSTSVQFSDKQFDQIEEVVYQKRLKSAAEAIRIAWDFFVKENFPNLV